MYIIKKYVYLHIRVHMLSIYSKFDLLFTHRRHALRKWLHYVMLFRVKVDLVIINNLFSFDSICWVTYIYHWVQISVHWFMLCAESIFPLIMFICYCNVHLIYSNCLSHKNIIVNVIVYNSLSLYLKKVRSKVMLWSQTIGHKQYYFC